MIPDCEQERNCNLWRFQLWTKKTITTIVMFGSWTKNTITITVTFDSWTKKTIIINDTFDSWGFTNFSNYQIWVQ